MRLLNKFNALTSASVLAFSSILAILVPQAAHAAANTLTWCNASGGNFSTTTNWSIDGNCADASSNSTAPGQDGNGDNLVFDNSILPDMNSPVINNDISNLQLGNITLQGNSTNCGMGGCAGFVLDGNAITLTGGVTVTGSDQVAFGTPLTISGNQSFTVASGDYINIGDQSKGGLSGSGNINLSGAGYLYLNADSSGYTGTLSTSSTMVIASTSNALGGGTATADISGTGGLMFGLNGSETFPNNFNLSGSGNAAGTGFAGACINLTLCLSDYTGTSDVATLSGAVVLGSNIDLGGTSGGILKLTGALSGNYAISLPSGQSAQLDVATSSNTSKTSSGASKSTLQVTTVSSSDKQPALGVNIGSNQEYIIDGERGYVFVGGLLKGDGEVNGLYVGNDGTLSPGHSPGCITDNGNYQQVGTYQAELGGTTACTGYDQLKVTGTVTLNDGSTPPTPGVLDVSLVNGFKPKVDNTFEIINNEGTKTITGTFKNLKEGSTFGVSGYVFKISYKGGTGNDVVLTVVSVPKSPDTGMALVSSHPEASMIGGLMAAGGLFMISRKVKFAGKRR